MVDPPSTRKRKTRSTRSGALQREEVTSPDSKEPDVIKPFFEYMVNGVRAQPASKILVWMKDGGVLAVLSHWKAEELENPDRYELLKTTLGTMKNLDKVQKMISDLVKLSMLDDLDAPTDSAGMQQCQRWAATVRDLIGIQPAIPGAEHVDSSKINLEWKHKAAWCLVFTVLMDLHRGLDGYFGKLLGGDAVEKYRPGFMKPSTDIAKPFLLQAPLKGNAKWISETLVGSEARARKHEAKVLSATRPTPVETADSGEETGSKRKRPNRRANRAGKLVQKQRAKKAKQNGEPAETGIDREPPAFYSRNRSGRDAAAYNLNRIGDGPSAGKPSESTITTATGTEGTRLVGAGAIQDADGECTGGMMRQGG